MSYDRRPYDDADTAGRMTLDAVACSARLVPRQARVAPDDVADLGRPGRLSERGLEVSEAAADLAARLHLHLD